MKYTSSVTRARLSPKHMEILLNYPSSLAARMLQHWDYRKGAGIASAFFTMMRNLFNYHLFGKKDLHPLYVVWYVTLRCNLVCKFCDDGTGKKYPEVRYPELNTDEALRMLELIRASCRSIYFTGGEPFVRKDFPILLRRARELGFWPIFVNTNLTLREPLEVAIHNIDVLIASLGSTDESKYDFIIQKKEGQTAHILETLRRCACWQADGGPRVVVNCVICSDRIQDTRSVLAFCQQNSLWFSPVPENRGFYIDSRLLTNPEYDQMVEALLAAKKDGSLIYGSLRGLETLLRGCSFQCYPTLAPHIYPNGDPFYPCHPLRQKMENILEKGSFLQVWRSSLERISPMPFCDNHCHLPCYVYNNQWMEHPIEMVIENFRTARHNASRKS